MKNQSFLAQKFTYFSKFIVTFAEKYINDDEIRLRRAYYWGWTCGL
jgi:hypothetical protein